jgi:hypothetical protein
MPSPGWVCPVRRAVRSRCTQRAVAPLIAVAHRCVVDLVQRRVVNVRTKRGLDGNQVGKTSDESDDDHHSHEGTEGPLVGLTAALAL